MLTGLTAESCDVLVLGGGSTACRAAVEAAEAGARTILLCKGAFGRSGSTFFPSNYGFGVQAHTGAAEDGDSTRQHYDDILKASRGLCDPQLARVLVEDAEERVRDLESYGIQLDRTSTGEYLQVRGCYDTKRRCFQITGLHQYYQGFGQQLRKLGVKVIEQCMALELIPNDEGVCAGVLAADRSGRLTVIEAGAVVIATGGGCAIYQHFLTTPEVTGDGYALGLRCGALLRNMEFQQFGWGLLSPIYRIPFLDRVLCYQPRITRGDGKPVYDGRYSEAQWGQAMAKRALHFPFTSEDESRIVDQTFLEIALSGDGGPNGGVFIDLSSVPFDEIKQAPLWPIWYSWLVSTGFDPTSMELEVTVFAHAFNGGIWIDSNGGVRVPGLYAAGEAASGPHGADRLGGNMQLACQVFGARAGAAAAKWAARKATPCSRPISSEAITRVLRSSGWREIGHSSQQNNSSPHSMDTVRKSMCSKVLVCREKDGLESVRLHIAEQARALPNWRTLLLSGDTRHTWQLAEAENILTVAFITTSAALEREESRGTHFRLDFPEHGSELYFVDVRMEEDEIAAERSPVDEPA